MKYALYVPLVAGAVMLKVRTWLFWLLTSVTSRQVTVPGAVVAMRQPIEPMRLFALPFWLVTVTEAAMLAPATTVVVAPPSTAALLTVPAAIV